MGKKSYSNIGFSSILVVFVTITFLSFGVLSLMTSRADNKLTGKTADRNKDYYSVLSDSERFLAELDKSLSDIYATSTDEDSYYHSVGQYLSTDNAKFAEFTTDYEYDTAAKVLSYTMRISSLQVLSVKVDITYPGAENDYHFYEIANQKTYTDIEEETTEEPLHLLGGN